MPNASPAHAATGHAPHPDTDSSEMLPGRIVPAQSLVLAGARFTCYESHDRNVAFIQVQDGENNDLVAIPRSALPWLMWSLEGIAS